MSSFKESTHILHKYEKKTPFIPIVFNSNYDINFYKLEKLHSFDCQKWGKIAASFLSFLREQLRISSSSSSSKKKISSNKKPEIAWLSRSPNLNYVSPPHAITDDELSVVHTKKFLHDINNSQNTIARASEVYFLAVLPLFMIRSNLLTPLKWQTSGSILAGYLALRHGFSINIGGGFHHCSAEEAGGFCLFADISLTIRYIWEQVDSELRVMIVDLDAHQGNGYERDVLNMFPKQRDQVFIFDMYNSYIYPNDIKAKAAINCTVELSSHADDERYLRLLRYHLDESLKQFRPDLLIYNAGSDILKGDPLGNLDITPKGLEERDEILFGICKANKIPIVMFTSGGYQPNNASVITSSMINLYKKNLITIFN